MKQNEDILELILNYKSQIQKFAFSILKDVQLAEDISQEVLFRCYLNYPKFRQEASLSSWIYRITANRCIDLLRSSNMSKCSVVDDFESLPITHHTPESQLFNKFNHRLVREHLLSLPQIYKQTLIMFYFEEKSIQEIQGFFKVPSSTVKTRLRRGRDLLKEKLTPLIE